MVRSRVFLVHWHDAGAAERAARLRARTDAVVIDLGRLPSHGRHFAVYLRQHKAIRHARYRTGLRFLRRKAR
jgi:hypothetical protein